MPRAQSPLKRLVNAVFSARGLCKAAQWAALVVASSASRKALPTCTASAPSCIAARTLAASLMPPAATTGSDTARRMFGRRANSPLCAFGSSLRNQPRCPPASSPCAMMPSAPCASSQRASATLVALDSTIAPVTLTASSSGAGGRPKWKLTTGGRCFCNSVSAVSSKGRRPGSAGISAAVRPKRARCGASSACQAARCASLTLGGRCAKKLTLYGASATAARMAASAASSASALYIAAGSEPRTPARQAAMVSASFCTPAIGA